MLLRDHLPNSRHGVPHWPCLGTWTGELENTRPRRETNVLESAMRSRIQSVGFYLCIDYEDSS